MRIKSMNKMCAVVLSTSICCRFSVFHRANLNCVDGGIIEVRTTVLLAWKCKSRCLYTRNVESFQCMRCSWAARLGRPSSKFLPCVAPSCSVASCRHSNSSPASTPSCEAGGTCQTGVASETDSACRAKAISHREWQKLQSVSA